jgi:lactoylglutathione lyase
MHIEHVALWADDLERLRRFYTELLDGISGAQYFNEKTGFRSYFVTFDSGARLELMSVPHEIGERPNPYIGYSHIAFSLVSRADVDATTQRLHSAGIEVVSQPRVTGDGYYESCVLDPEGNRVEITC